MHIHGNLLDLVLYFVVAPFLHSLSYSLSHSKAELRPAVLFCMIVERFTHSGIFTFYVILAILQLAILFALFAIYGTLAIMYTFIMQDILPYSYYLNL